MNRRTMIAAFTAAGALSLVAAPSFAQDSSLMNSKLVSESPAKASGALPLPSLQPGEKRAASAVPAAAASADTASSKTMSLSKAAPNLPIK